MNANLRKFLSSDLQLKHTRGGRFSLTFGGKTELFKTIDDIKIFIAGQTPRWKGLAAWEAFKADEGFATDPEGFMERLEGLLFDEIADLMTKKTEKMMSMGSGGSSFDSFAKAVTEPPIIGFNTVDKQILQRLRYCKADDSIYLKTKHGLKLIGTLGLVQRDPTLNGLCEATRETLGLLFNERKATWD